MKTVETAKLAIKELLEAGAEHAQCLAVRSAKRELNADAGQISLLRTTTDNELRLVALKNGRRGETLCNRTDAQSLKKAAREAVESALASQPDAAHAIAPESPAKTFSCGPKQPDAERMIARMEEYLAQSAKLFPSVIVEQAILDFTRSESVLLNSNGVVLVASRGVYSFMAVFTAKDGKASSSVNYTVMCTDNLDGELLGLGSLKTLMEQSAGQIYTHPVPGNFTGDIIVTPECLDNFLEFLTLRALRDGQLIAGTSVYKDKLGQRIASPGLTVSSRPAKMPGGYFITPDGYAAENVAIIKDGVLQNFLLSLYGSRKTGLKRVANAGGCCVIEPGGQSLAEMIKSVKKGVLLSRFSGGAPSDNGDFSGVAKNSYYIEEGKIRHPLSETMVSGNIPEMFKNILALSRERVNSGHSIYPWIKFGGMAISGK
jgi:PmbA protein